MKMTEENIPVLSRPLGFLWSLICPQAAPSGLQLAPQNPRARKNPRSQRSRSCSVTDLSRVIQILSTLPLPVL